MLRWAAICLGLGIVLGLLGFGGLGGAFVGIAKLLFFVAVTVFVILLVLGLLAANKADNAE